MGYSAGSGYMPGYDTCSDHKRQVIDDVDVFHGFKEGRISNTVAKVFEDAGINHTRIAEKATTVHIEKLRKSAEKFSVPFKKCIQILKAHG